MPFSEHLDTDLRSRLGLRAEDGFAGVPVIGKAGLRGVLAVYRKESQADTRSSDEEMLSAFADQAAIALDHVERNLLLREAEAQIALAARLAAMGTLVAGVAHEINNPLTAALSDQEMALELVQEIRNGLRNGDPIELEVTGRKLDEVTDALEDAVEAGTRIAQIVKDLSAFGRPNPARTTVRLIDVVEKAMRWLPASVEKNAVVNVENGGAPDVVASFGQIQQVVVNLVTNAAKAARPGRSGEITIRVGPGAPDMARLEVIDHGVGIDPALRKRIFDPIFTTRQAGIDKGMGLGLSISYNIVANHGGALTVTSEVGEGSTFRVELPAASAKA